MMVSMIFSAMPREQIIMATEVLHAAAKSALLSGALGVAMSPTALAFLLAVWQNTGAVAHLALVLVMGPTTGKAMQLPAEIVSAIG